MLYQALEYAKQGLSVIPLKSRSKIPLFPWEIYQNVRADSRLISQWFMKAPTANIGIVLGKISNLIVLDIDGIEGKDKLNALDISSPITVVTGNGFHLYFAYSEGLGNECVWGGAQHNEIRIKSDGGYVLAPPSIHPSGKQYKWINGFTVKDLPILPIERLKLKRNNLSVPTTKPDNWITNSLNNLKAGNRNDTFTRIAGKLHHIGLLDSDIFSFLRPYASRSGFSDSELQTIVNSISRYKLEDEGPEIWSCNVNDFKNYLNSEDAKNGLETGIKSFDKATKGLKEGEIFTIGARTSVGKTTLSLMVARNLLERRVRVLIFSTEMSRFSIIERLIQAYGNTKLERLVEFNQLLFIVDKGSPKLVDVQTAIEKVKPNVIIFDHIQHTAPISISDRENVSRFIRGLKDCGRKSGICVIVCSQIKRLWRDRGGIESPPTLSDLKESGTIEEESAAVLLLSNLSSPYGSDRTTLLADLAKNRYGNAIKFSLEFDKENGAFREIE